MPKFTKRFVEAIAPDSEKTLKFWDAELKGFGLIVLPSGRRTYCIEYRNVDRVKKRLKIGVHGTITTEEARDLAKKRLGQVAHGEDPTEQKKQLSNLATVEELANNYLERYGYKKRPKSLQEDQKLLQNIILPALGRLKVIYITRRELEALHKHYQDTPYQANRALSLLSKMFNLAMSWGWRNDNPATNIQKYQEEKRDRWLDQEELDRLWEVLDRHSGHMTTYVFKFLILTGARKGEALGATWDQFDLEKGVWTKPSHLTKQKKKEHLPLSEKAVEVLQIVKKRTPKGSVYVFPGRIEGEPLKEIKTFWKTALKEAKLENIRIHDLRHTHASHLVSSGLSLSIVGKLLGHTQASTTQRYAHLADEPLRQAAELFGSKVGNKLPLKSMGEK
ncbi:MAG: tyrosine-type recombinase/integrase [Alphaproteobacteria bacterium]|nr:tyrosine-type recombinase/integrase [Alphaproteobacteria bacterium]MBP9777313.1 tyrosine-type recombinase/integrase [Alphaproteobacteria bacterium]